MKKILLILMSIAYYSSFAQINTLPVKEVIIEEKVSFYDSLTNMPVRDHREQIIGQTLYYVGSEDDNSEYEHDRRFSVIKKGVTKSLTSSINLRGCYFFVYAIEKENRYSDKAWYLINKNNGDSLKYKTPYSTYSTFVNVGHFEKLKQLYVGKFFYLKNTDYYGSPERHFGLYKMDTRSMDYSTFLIDSKWKCIDVSIDPTIKYWSSDDSRVIIILENEKYGKRYSFYEANGYMNTPFKHQFIDEGKYNAEQKILSERRLTMVKKFGSTYGTLIADGKVRIGMSKEMCRASWGEPNDINKTTGSFGVHEQWVYYNSYLYFENGKLTTIQN